MSSYCEGWIAVLVTDRASWKLSRGFVYWLDRTVFLCFCVRCGKWCAHVLHFWTGTLSSNYENKKLAHPGPLRPIVWLSRMPFAKAYQPLTSTMNCLAFRPNKLQRLIGRKTGGKLTRCCRCRNLGVETRKATFATPADTVDRCLI